jgi:hypothetical protein
VNRREYLTAVGVAGVGSAAGCIGGVLTPSYTGGLQRRVELVSQDPVPAEYDLEISVDLLPKTITDEHTARVLITTSTSGDGIGIPYGTDRCAMFNRTHSRSEPHALWLAQLEEENWTRTGEDGNGWQVERTGNFFGYGCSGYVESGVEFSNEYLLVDNGKGGPYLPPDEYRWERVLRVWERDPPEETAETFRWGFSMAIEKPQSSA